jgi:hypothetical protein
MAMCGKLCSDNNFRFSAVGSVSAARCVMAKRTLLERDRAQAQSGTGQVALSWSSAVLSQVTQLAVEVVTTDQFSAHPASQDGVVLALYGPLSD